MNADPPPSDATDNERPIERRRAEDARIAEALTATAAQAQKVDTLSDQVSQLIDAIKDLRRSVGASAAVAQRQIRQRTWQLLALVVVLTVFFAGVLVMLRSNASRARVDLAATVADNCEHVATLQDTLVEILQGFRAQARSEPQRDQMDKSIARLQKRPCDRPARQKGSR